MGGSFLLRKCQKLNENKVYKIVYFIRFLGYNK